MPLRSELERALSDATTGSLTLDAWSDLYDRECILESRLIEEASQAGQVSGDFARAAGLWEIVADLNKRLASVGTVLLEHLSNNGSFDDLKEAAQDATDLTTFAEGQALLLTSIRQRISGSPAEAEATAEAAHEKFTLLAEGDSAFSAAGAVNSHVSEGYRLGSQAIGEQLRLNYEDASLTFLQAKEALKRAQAELVDQDEIDNVALAAIISDIRGFDLASMHSLFVKAIVNGDYDMAATRGNEIISHFEFVDDPDTLPLIGKLMKLNQQYFAGYLAYVRAEIAVDRREWSEARKRLNEADQEWRRTGVAAVSLGIPQSRQIAERTQAVSSQVIGTCQRRITREEAHFAEVLRLRAENADLQNQILHLANKTTVTALGAVSMKEQHASGDIVGRDKTGGDKVGRDKTGGDKTHGNKQEAGGDILAAGGDIDFSKIWADHANEIDLAALAEDLQKLRVHLQQIDDGEHESQIDDVAVAQVAASEGNGPKALKRLKSAGKWVLDSIPKVGFPIAITALKVALGLPAA